MSRGVSNPPRVSGRVEHSPQTPRPDTATPRHWVIALVVLTLGCIVAPFAASLV